MNMKFGTKLDEFKGGGGGGGGDFLSYIQDEVTTLQFLQDYDEAIVVGFHFEKDADGKTFSYPCPGGEHRDECPGCLSGDREIAKTTSRIVIIARDEKSGYVNAYALPISLKDFMSRAWRRNDTILDRPFTIYRDKSGNRTTYDMEREDPYGEIPTVEYDLPDIDAILKNMWRYGTDLDYRSDQKSEREKSKAEPKVSRDSKPEPEEPKAKPKADPKADEPAPFDGDGGFPRGEITESEVRAMSYIALIRLANEYKIPIDEEKVETKQDLADLIIWKMS